MITANDLKNIDAILFLQERVINQSKENRILINHLREQISKELKKIKIKIK